MTDAKPEDWTKLDRVRYILDHWQDIYDPGITGTWATFTGTSHQAPASKRPVALPRMAEHRSVRQLERALCTLATSEPDLARHLKAYRCNAEWRTADRWYVRRLPSGKRDLVEQRARERIVPSWVSLTKVLLAEELLARLLPEYVEIPPDLWRALTKPD